MIESYFYFLNILNIRFVTKNPPTTLIVAKIIAINPKIEVKSTSPKKVSINIFLDPDAIIAPIIVIPEIAFEPDIKGV